MDETNVAGMDEELLWATKSFAIEGMTCDRCVEKVTRTLQQLNGVKATEVNLQDAKVTVTFDTTKTDVPTLHEALLRTGYRPALRVNGNN
ncbi:MAG: heavy-metal-associated domain-containing protein [Verrucomicrobiota bacterium]|nr:heavy-metal-associated domain-containing protein [Verrucomicrobiota bacterium]